VGDLVVAEVVDVVVVLAHPVPARVFGEDLPHAPHAQLLVQLQVLRGGDLFHGGAENLQLGPRGGVDGGGRDDVAVHAVAVAGQCQGVGVDAAGAVDQGLPRADRAPL